MKEKMKVNVQTCPSSSDCRSPVPPVLTVPHTDCPLTRGFSCRERASPNGQSDHQNQLISITQSEKRLPTWVVSLPRTLIGPYACDFILAILDLNMFFCFLFHTPLHPDKQLYMSNDCSKSNHQLKSRNRCLVSDEKLIPHGEINHRLHRGLNAVRIVKSGLNRENSGSNPAAKQQFTVYLQYADVHLIRQDKIR